MFDGWLRFKAIYFAVVSMGLSVVFTSCGPAPGFMAPPPPTVTAAKPLKQTVTTFDTFTGRTEAVDFVEIRARVAGFLEEMYFTEGSVVEQGQLLYRIEQDVYKADLEKANADVEAAKANFQAALTEYNFIKEAFDAEAASRKEVIEARAKRDQTEAQIGVAEASVTQAQINLGYTEIHSPNVGRINRTMVDPGNLVGHGEATLLTTVTTFDPMYVYFTVNQRDLLMWLEKHPEQRRDPGSNPNPPEVFLLTADGKQYGHPAKIDFASPEVDPKTGTVTLRAIVPNPDSLLYPGIFIRVRAPQEQAEAIVIPRIALQRDMQGDYVMRITELSDEAKQAAAAQLETLREAAKGTPRERVVGDLKPPTKTVERVNVTLGSVVGEANQVVTQGLKETDQIVIKGLQRARPGAAIYVTEKPLEPAKQPSVAPKDDHQATSKD